MKSDKAYIVGEYVKGNDINNPMKEMRGWVTGEYPTQGVVLIKPDDVQQDLASSNHSEISLDIKSVVRCNPVKGWEEANSRQIPLFTKLKHFKGGLYQIIAIANHVDYGKCVVYQSLDNPNLIWVREYAEFMSEVDKVKYPDSTQKYRFEQLGE